MALIDDAAAYFHDLQDRICDALSRIDGTAFRQDEWQRPGGGGGRTRVLSEGTVFEKAGVNVSDVHGEFRPEFARQLPGSGMRFRATGISLVLHPRNPHAPTVHANFRRLERQDGESSNGWFGGGADLTPSYVRAEDARHFHRTLKAACDAHDQALFPRFKRWCDEYFFIPHRGEPRGIGGIFFDYLGAGAEAAAGAAAGKPGDGEPAAVTNVETDPARSFAFVRACGDAFLPAYLPILERRKDEPWTDAERRWQLLRRGRYVEFNLVYDRGTIFGLKTDGRVESILMSLPLEARWEYDAAPAEGTREAASLADIVARRDWANA